MGANERILVVDDEDNNLATMRFNFGRKFQLDTCSSAKEALERLAEQPVAVLIVDQRMPELDGLEFIRQAKERNPRSLAILLTAYADIDVVAQALNSGLVYRYLQKPWNRTELEATMRQALERYRLEEENLTLLAKLEQLNRFLGREVEERGRMETIVGQSAGIMKVLELVRQVASSNSAVLISGESGTGKELVAREIHRQSQRSAGPFIRVNCGALAPGIIESEFFGHEKGAFTGAIQKKLGRFELADKGTIFLDEVGDLEAETQIKLLRVLQEKEFERVGGNETLKVDVRVVCATHRDLPGMVKSGAFREDLYYRIAVFPIAIPPLRERREDIPLLAEHLLRKLGPETGRAFSGFTPEARRVLTACPWPGNVRELENAVERAMITSGSDVIGAPELAFLNNPLTELHREAQGLPGLLSSLEAEEIRGALARNGGSVSLAADELGVKRTALYYKIKKFGLDK